MVYRYRTNLKKVFLTDSELYQLNERIAKSNCQNFSAYARKVLLNPSMSFVTINTDTYEQLVFELRRIGNNINQIAKFLNFIRQDPNAISKFSFLECFHTLSQIQNDLHDWLGQLPKIERSPEAVSRARERALKKRRVEDVH